MWTRDMYLWVPPMCWVLLILVLKDIEGVETFVFCFYIRLSSVLRPIVTFRISTFGGLKFIHCRFIDWTPQVFSGKRRKRKESLCIVALNPWNCWWSSSLPNMGHSSKVSGMSWMLVLFVKFKAEVRQWNLGLMLKLAKIEAPRSIFYPSLKDVRIRLQP